MSNPSNLTTAGTTILTDLYYLWYFQCTSKIFNPSGIKSMTAKNPKKITSKFLQFCFLHFLKSLTKKQNSVFYPLNFFQKNQWRKAVIGFHSI